MKTLLKTDINFEMYHEDNAIVHPLEGLTGREIVQHLNELHRTYPGYSDYVYEQNWKYHGYGAKTGWYELYGIKD